MQEQSTPAGGRPRLSGAQSRKRRAERGGPRMTEAERRAKIISDRRRQLRRAVRNRAFLDAYKVERGCSDCGYNRHPAALDFDHLPGAAKRRDISKMAHQSRAAILAEIAKCELVCANCHRIRGMDRRNGDARGEGR